MKEIKTENGIPMPEFKHEGRGRKAKYPFKDLVRVGMSFFVPMVEPRKLFNVRCFWQKKLAGCGMPWKFKMKITSKDGVKGTRVWRVE